MDGYDPLDTDGLVEQTQRGRDFAKVARIQFDAFIEQDFSEEQALWLMDPWVRSMMGGEAS